MQPKATILKSAICLTNVVPRPSPTMFYFPGLSTKPVYENAFAWQRNLQSQFSDIREEYLNLVKNKVNSDYKKDKNSLHTGNWDWHSFVSKGEEHNGFEKWCPKTAMALRNVPGFMKQVPFAYSFFSTLGKKSSIAAHSAPCNIRLRVHLPIVVPKNCGIRIGDQVYRWKVGECLVFDDSYDHEAWNDHPEEDRVVLLFDIWHPEITELERVAVQNMFQGAKDKGWIQNSKH